MRLVALALAGSLLLRQAPPAVPEPQPEPFDQWLTGVIAEARERGFSDDLLAKTLEGVEPLQRVVDNDRNQAEVVLTLDRYLSSRLTTAMVRRGREMARLHNRVLRRIEEAYGVPRQYVLAIWGLETRYGRLTGRTPVFQALATLAWEPRRADFFRGQLFDALRMAEGGNIEVSRMTGSWAGAMGQTQFLPSSYLEYAVDFDEDGRRDIWRSVPDSLASIANYLKGYGWQAGESWGREVQVSAAVRSALASESQRGEGCYAIRTMTVRRGLDEWNRLGVRRVDGRPLPASQLDAGLAEVGDRAFLLYQNYDAILGYNCAHYYALSVAMLADRLR